MAAREHATEAAVMRAHRLQLLPTVAVESETSMTTNFFQGKWAILDTDNNNYLSGDSGGIAAVTNSITPRGTFMLYATTPEPGFEFVTAAIPPESRQLQIRSRLRGRICN